ncbi:MAG: hypothetical protein SVX28_04160 [Pseudomonadota bacterium]|nr:hypothetical protein [Pseudomonadota bacterium]
MTDTPETIYLIPDADGHVWCDDPAPGEGMDPDEAVKYVRSGTASAIERDAAFRQRDLAYKQRDEMELKWSKERMGSRELAERIEELEAMIKVFRGCIETGVYPAQGSRCHKLIYELVGDRDSSGGEQ